MTRVKKTLWQKILHFFMKFNMCSCKGGPKFEVIGGILRCEICRKPAEWASQPK